MLASAVPFLFSALLRPPPRGPVLPGPRLLFGLLLLQHGFGAAQNVQLTLLHQSWALHLKVALLSGLISVPLALGSLAGWWWLARRVQRGLHLGAAQWRHWLAFVGAFAIGTLLGVGLRTGLWWLCQPLALPLAPPSWASLAAVLLSGGMFPLGLEWVAFMHQSSLQRLKAREALALQLRASQAQIIAADDAQKMALAERLHGSFQALLLVAKVQVQSAAQAAQQPEKQAEALSAAIRALSLLQAETQAVLPGPDSARENMSLSSACEAMVQRFQALRPVLWSVSPEALGRRCQPELGEAACHLLTEGLLNAFRHAGPCQVAVRLRLASPNEALLEVVDEGVGFDPNLARKGLGLGALPAALLASGGQYALEAKAGQGCRLSVRLPLMPESLP